MTPDQIISLKEDVAKTIQVTVNGKVDKMTIRLDETIGTVNNMRQEITMHNEIHGTDMKRILPVLEAFEEGQRDLRSATKAGKIVLWLAATVTAIGGAYLILKQIF